MRKLQMIILSLPPSINRTYKTTRDGGFYKAKEVIDWIDENLWEIKKQWKEEPIGYDAIVHVNWYLKRDRDIDAGIKSLLDLLQKGNVVTNDSVIKRAIITKYKSDEPRVQVEITRW